MAPGDFDVVLSAGMLTQLLEPGSPIAHTLALRDHHLAAMTRLGRRAVLVTDTVPTSTAPSLLGLGQEELEPAMAALVAARRAGPRGRGSGGGGASPGR